jgi:Signal transduction histidine kinase
MAGSSPTLRLLVGLGVTLLAVTAFSFYALSQIHGLRRLQRETVDRNRKDSLQLIRIQNDLNSLALSLRDMLEGSEPYPLEAYAVEFKRIRSDLEDAFRLEKELSPASRLPDQQNAMEASLKRLWDRTDRMFALAASGKEGEARQMIRSQVLPEQAALTALVARLLVANNEAEQQTADRIEAIYQGVERNVYYFLSAVLLAITAMSLYLIRANKRIFGELASLSRQRQVLAQKLISVQEDIFRSVSRELHDDFGQILTAIGVMLRRAERKGLPKNSPFRSDLLEVRETAQQTLEKLRSLSQTLHPNVLEDFGLEKTLEWYVRQFEKQTGLVIRYEKRGIGPLLKEKDAIHVYRILQEALNNVVRHARVAEAEVLVEYTEEGLRLSVEDHGVGMPDPRPESARGLGLIGMQERAELLRGRLRFERPAQGGLRVALEIPLREAAV